MTNALARLFPDDPPRFLARAPHGYHDVAAIRRELEDAGFSRVTTETVAAQSRAASPRVPAVAYCQGTVLRTEIEARAPEHWMLRQITSPQPLKPAMAAVRLPAKFRRM